LPAPAPAEGPFTIATVSRLDPVKRLTIAIEAVARTPNVRLNIVGDGCERKKLAALVRKRGVETRVRFLGHLQDPRPAIESCDAIINCTRAEGLPLAVLEAAAMARPTLAFAGGGMPEVVQDRRTGWLVKEDSIGAWTAALSEASADRPRAAALGIQARQWVNATFGIETMCRQYASVYANLATGVANIRD